MTSPHLLETQDEQDVKLRSETRDNRWKLASDKSKSVE